VKCKKNYLGIKIIMIIFILLFIVWLVRIFSERQLDDISPEIECDPDLIDKSDILFVIPKYNGYSISDNVSWCESILRFDKKLGMHGVYHTYKEYSEERSEEYLEAGVVIFEECFGFTPESFKAPQMALAEENKGIIRKKMKIVGKINQIFHKTYHCGDTGILSNRLTDFI
jgi:hypothetical protein